MDPGRSLRRADGRLALPPGAPDQVDPDAYILGRDSFGQFATVMASCGAGDERYATTSDE